ncbi:MAG: hypothetical protein P8Y37_09635, partial [Anaerolineales bacterium]
WNSINSIQDHTDFITYLENYQSELRNFQDKYARSQDLKREDIKLYWTYGTFSPCYSLRFGNDFSKRLYTDEINQICPSDLQYDIWDDTIAGTDETGLDSLFNKQTNIVLVGNRNTLEEYQAEDHIDVIYSELDNLGFIVYQESP